MENKEFVLDQVTIKKLLTIYKLVIPDFQRSFVWKKQKKQQLLESLFRGFPIGAITLYEDGGAYYIIDGLQRINTLNQYLSSPSSVIRFDDFYEKIEDCIDEFMRENGIVLYDKHMRQCIKTWYEKLNKLYEFEKVSVLNSVLMSSTKEIAEVFKDLTKVEELLDIAKGKIEIVHDDVALIIYRGCKEDLPDLFRNINTGSIALSQYEILQSMWINNILDKEFLQETYEAFNKELELIRDRYEIQAVMSSGKFDIFKNIVGLNHEICCKKNANFLFHFSAFRELPNSDKEKKNTDKYFDNDGIAFEIYSTLLIHSPNKIVKAVDSLYKNGENITKISKFLCELNHIILLSIDDAVREIQRQEYSMSDSKYHSLYVLAGIIWSRYNIDLKNLIINEIPLNEKIYNESLNLEKHIMEKWFMDEKRQISFFNIKLEELAGLQTVYITDSGKVVEAGIYDGILAIKINGEIIMENTVKAFYRTIFKKLIKMGAPVGDYIPYATGKKRYLINKTGKHINEEPFVSPICVGEYYIETHKSKRGATRDIYNFIKKLGVDVEYVK